MTLGHRLAEVLICFHRRYAERQPLQRWIYFPAPLVHSSRTGFPLPRLVRTFQSSCSLPTDLLGLIGPQHSLQPPLSHSSPPTLVLLPLAPSSKVVLPQGSQSAPGSSSSSPSFRRCTTPQFGTSERSSSSFPSLPATRGRLSPPSITYHSATYLPHLFYRDSQSPQHRFSSLFTRRAFVDQGRVRGGGAQEGRWERAGCGK